MNIRDIQLPDIVSKIAPSDNKYLYNGKELQDDQLGGVNLDWYDYVAWPIHAKKHDLEIHYI